MLATRAGGDGRVALAALERAAEATRAAGEDEIGVEAVEDALQRKALLYDREGGQALRLHLRLDQGNPRLGRRRLDLLPRGDARGGEDPRFIARRMVIFASEDVGNADPQALVVATAAAQAVDRVGPRSARSTSPRRPPTSPSRRSRTPRPGRSHGRRRTSASTAPPSPALPAGRPLPGRPQARPGRGLPLPARGARGGHRSAADTGVDPRRALLRADRARLRGRAPEAAGGPARPARRARARGSLAPR